MKNKNITSIIITVLATMIITFLLLAWIGVNQSKKEEAVLTRQEVWQNNQRNLFIENCTKSGYASIRFCGCSYDYLSGKGENYLDVRDNSPKLWDKWLEEAVEVCLPFAN